MGLLKMDRSGSEPSLVPEWLKNNNNNGGVGIASRHSSFVNRPQHSLNGISDRDSRFYPNFSRGRFPERERDREAWNRDWRSHDRQVGGDRGPSGFHRVPVARLDVENGWCGFKSSERLRMASSNRFVSSRNSSDTDYIDSSMAPKTPEAICSKMPEVFSPKIPEAPSPAFKMSEALVHVASSPIQTAMEQQTQRLEEIALKQSRQLVPMKPSLPKTMVLPRKPMKSSDLKSGQPASPVTPYRTPTPALSVLKATPGRLQVLSKESTAPVASRAPQAPMVDRKPASDGKVGDVHVHEDRKPLAHGQNRSNFYNAIRKKAATNGENRNPQESTAMDTPQKKACEESSTVVSELIRTEESGDAGAVKELKPAEAKNGRWCEKEETALLRSLGWEDKPDGEPLTEEEIYSFVREVSDCKQLGSLLTEMFVLQHMTALASTPSVVNGKNQVVCNVLLDLSAGSLASPSSSGSESEDCELELGKVK
ncbi:uncharacterized protein LOC9648933 isoform X1 [Selaginella moellendorffii]|uniref:uncharacterized protein LOC9648933 isoform X1 n=1 Tax=Selaginella moellendorffii TaxID=88036 RepID=UPI000D1C60F2|nr:uncharacterized protein LOC9648933 isoform X1 [Selaginella moellendorffii]|eukprot:XP_024514762.1 uncharacterized protein LOC9648933 isoform X1 [Selaginella moellendorffii]